MGLRNVRDGKTAAIALYGVSAAPLTTNGNIVDAVSAFKTLKFIERNRPEVFKKLKLFERTV